MEIAAVKKNASKSRLLVFLDRDGTINEDTNHIHRLDQLVLLPRSAAAIRKLNEFGARVVIITNQSVVARGMCSEKEVEAINQRLVDILTGLGAKIDGVYYCPHHKEKAIIAKYKVECLCRKPKTRMLETAAKRFGITPDNCVFIGDMSTDIQTGKNFGCKTILVRTGFAGSDKRYDAKADLECDDLYDAVEKITKTDFMRQEAKHKTLDSKPERLNLRPETGNWKQETPSPIALIVAGGLGTRLASITKKVPKPMIEVKGKPILEYQIEHLKRCGITDIVISIGYLGHKIEGYFGNGTRFGVNITYSWEKEPLGTGGAVKLAEPFIAKRRFVLVYGDLLFDFDINDLIQFHEKKGGLGTLTVQASTHPYDCDILEVDKDKMIVRFIGKPKHGDKFKNISNAGVYCFESEVLKYFPNGISMLDRDVLPKVVKEGGKLYTFMVKKEVHDLGTLDRLKKVRGG